MNFPVEIKAQAFETNGPGKGGSRRIATNGMRALRCAENGRILVVDERRKTVRRHADRELLKRVAELQSMLDRRGESGAESKRESAGHARRQIIRHNCKVAIAVKVGVSSGYGDTWDVASVRVKGRILDLSTGGASLFTEQRFETGQELALVIRLRDGEDIHANSTVRWVKMVPQKGGYASGVQFTHMSDKDRRLLGKFLTELEQTAGL